MVDVSEKAVTRRTAQASGRVHLGKTAFNLLMTAGSPKGDVFETAKIAGMMAAKNTAGLIPYCHPLVLDGIKMHFNTDKKNFSLRITSEVMGSGKTGFEMEALAAVATAALTVYDMMKWADHGIVISDVRLLSKTGGKSGDYRARECDHGR